MTTSQQAAKSEKLVLGQHLKRPTNMNPSSEPGPSNRNKKQDDRASERRKRLEKSLGDRQKSKNPSKAEKGGQTIKRVTKETIENSLFLAV